MIDREQVQKVALLARLQLTEAEETQFTTQLNDILDYFEQLSELDTSDVPPTAWAIEATNVTRADEVQPERERELMLQSAPDREDDFFKVPKILGEA